MTAPDAPSPIFELPIRIYYEDTDAAGVVYYANYFKFFERCRTEWIRRLGREPLPGRGNPIFIVRKASAEYLKSGHLDDEIIIRLEIERLGRSTTVFRQYVFRGEEKLVQGVIETVCVDPDTLKSIPVPGWLREQVSTPG
jgi:acyl-CoA thioester hydrolase